jgi:signal transduction histidine kinase
VLAIAVALVGALHWLDRAAGIDTWWIGSIVIGVGLGGFGLLLVRRLPANPIGWLMLAGGLVQAVLGAAREWAVYASLTAPGSLPGASWAAWVGTWPFLVPIATLPLVLLLFPDGRLPTARWRVVPWAVAAAAVLGCGSEALRPGRFTPDLTLRNPIGVHSPSLGGFTNAAQLVLTLAIVAAIASLVARTWGSSGELRQQLKWIAFAGSLLGVVLAAELLPVPDPVGLAAVAWVGPLLVVCFLAAVTMAVLRYRLWDIDLLISRSLVYGTVTLVLGAAYVGIVAASGRMRDHPVEIGSSLVAAALVAVAFAPLRDLLQRRLDRRLYGDRNDPYRALTRLGDRLGGRTERDSVLDEVVDAVGSSLHLGFVAIVVPEVGTVASTGALRTPAIELPLVFRTDVVGTLVVSHRAGASIGPRERAVLGSLVPPVAAVVHAVSVSLALQSSRYALVTLREQERRRVHRDLHDGLGPALAAVRMKVAGARLLIDGDPEGAKDVLGQLSDDIRSAIADLRRLVYDLQPPALEEIGLVSALAEQATAFTGRMDDGAYLDVELDAPTALPPLPAAVEVAVYRIVCESLNNVVHHARASRCRIALAYEDARGLTVLVDDDGAGCPPDRRGGVGVRSMVERAAELDGSCVVERSPIGGTRVAAVLPVPGPPFVPEIVAAAPERGGAR